MSKSPQLVRQWKLLQMLEASRTGCTIQELIAETEMSDKTLRRDLKALATVFDMSVYTGDYGMKRWKLKPLTEQLGFNHSDLLSIFMSRQFLEPLAGTPFWQGIQSVQRRVTGALGEQSLRYIEKLSGKLQATAVGASDYSQRGDMIDNLMVAIEDRRVTLIVYQSMQATEPVEQEVYPLGMVHHRGSLYLIGWSSRREEVRNFKLDRVDSVDVQNLQYQVPVDFDLQAWLGHCFGVWRSGEGELKTIKIRFAKSASRYVQESTWHASQQMFPQSDGTLIVEFQLPDIEEILKWILSFGKNATALEPPELVERINDEVQQMLKTYEVTRGQVK